MSELASESSTPRAARAYLLGAGAFLLAVAVVGFTVDTSFPLTPHHVSGHAHVFGVFQTNGWHTLAALALAVPSLWVALARPSLSGTAAVLVGAANGVVLVAFAVWDPAVFLIASNDADQVMHAVLAAAGIATGAWSLRPARLVPS